MPENFKSAAILQLLEKCSYENGLVINGWKQLNSIVSLHCKNIFEVSDEEKISFYIEPVSPFDLIIAFLPSQETLDFIKNCKTSAGMEAILVTSSQWTYNRSAVTEFKKLVEISRSDKKLHLKDFLVTDTFRKFEIQKYYGFPNIIEPELILTQSYFHQYRRYWSWIKGVQNRRFLSLLIEYFLVCKLKSCILSPFTIFKVN